MRRGIKNGRTEERKVRGTEEGKTNLSYRKRMKDRREKCMEEHCKKREENKRQ